ncbi:MAG TPA: hypothetical protein VLB75_01165 [Steroidobacteraceae bacterium]|nr:hypothetical protein [Steroidobacteraceae bacterium]
MAAKRFKPIAFLASLIPMTEKRYARRAGRSVLDVYWQVRKAHPELTGKALYTEVVAARSHTEPEAARTILSKAEQSFAEWPRQRDLIFLDVVAYLVFDEFMRSHPLQRGTCADMRRVIAKIIPSNL